MRTMATPLAMLFLAVGCGSDGGKGPPHAGMGGAGGSSAAGGTGAVAGGGAGGAGASGGSGASSGAGGFGGGVDAGPPPSADWVKRIGGTGSDQAYDVARNAAGDVFVGGTFEGSVDFGTGVKSSNGSSDAFLLALGGDGTPKWVKTFGGSSFDQVSGVAVDGQGNIVITASISAAVNLGSGAVKFGGDKDVLVAKLDPTGAPLWTKSFGGTGFDVPGEVAVDASGAVIVGGSFEGSVDFGGGARTAKGSADGFVVKLTSQGQWVWDYGFGSAQTKQEYAMSVAVDAAGNAYVSGMSAVNATDVGFFVARLGAQSGSADWTRPIAQDLGANRAEAIAVGANAVFVGGWVQKSVSFGAKTVTSSSDDPVLVAFAPSDGAVSWHREWHGSGNDHVYGIATLGDDVVLTGRIAEAVSLDGAQATQGCQDAFLARVGPDGSPLGAGTFGGSDCGDFGRSVAAYDAKRVLLVGEVNGDVNVFGKPTSGQSDDAFVALITLP